MGEGSTLRRHRLTRQLMGLGPGGQMAESESYPAGGCTGDGPLSSGAVGGAPEKNPKFHAGGRVQTDGPR